MLLKGWTEANIQAVATYYPQFERVEPPSGSGAILAWEGTISPLDGSAELDLILSDLARGVPVLSQAGRIIHDPDCTHPHSSFDFASLINPPRAAVRFRVLAFPPKWHPKAFAIDPEISKITVPGQPHLNFDSSVCAYSPANSVLPWDGRTLRFFLHYVAIWALKHHVWTATAATGKPIWLGPAEPHRANDILKNVDPTDPCVCGRPRKFKKCCMKTYQQLAARERQLGI